MKTVICVAHYNTPELLDRLLASIRDSAERATNLIVWDDGSNKDYRGFTCCHHLGGEHLGVHPTFNALFTEAMRYDPEEIIFLGSDTIITQFHWLEIWRQAIGRIKEPVGMASALLMDESGKVLFGGANEGMELQMQGAHKHYGQPISAVPKCPSLQPWLTGSALWINPAALWDVAAYRNSRDDLGAGAYFSNDYEIFCGDRELGYTMRECGWNLALIPQVQIIHSHGGSQSVKTLPGFNRDAILKHDESILYARWGKMINEWEE